MSLPRRPIAYVLATTNHGSMIVNRNDHARYEQGIEYGVGQQLLAQACFDPAEVQMVLTLLSIRRRHHGHGVFAIDGGANLGVHTLEWARHMHGWGRVLAFEAQEFVFYALAGNIALNNCWNASARWMALGERAGTIQVPEPDYLRPGSFGSLEIRRGQRTEFIGQNVSYDEDDCITTPMQDIDSLALERLDFLKLDIEGMEMEALRGARQTIERHHPMMLVEVVKSDAKALEEWLLALGYYVLVVGMNMVAVHAMDPAAAEVRAIERLGLTE